MVPANKTKQAPKAVKTKKTKPEVSADTPSTPAPAIHTRINGIEMMICAGCAQSDIESVFKAAMAL